MDQEKMYFEHGKNDLIERKYVLLDLLNSIEIYILWKGRGK